MGITKVHVPRFDMLGKPQVPTNTKQVITAWDEMLCAKCHPGQYTTDYCAGMNKVNLPTNIFSVSNSHSSCYVFDGAYGTTAVPLGTKDYTVIMWSSSMTAFKGDGYAANIPQSDKLGGMVMF